LNIDILEGEELTLDNFHQAAATSGLFANKRLIIIKNIFNQKNKTILDKIAEELEKIQKENILIFSCAEIPKEKNDLLLKKLLKADKIEQFPLLKPGQVYHWVQKEVKKRGAIIDNNAVSYLVEAIGNDLWRLNNELDKLSSYTKRITMQDADLFIDSPLDDNIFNFTDAISNQDTRKALRLLHDQLDSGANEFMLISMLARQIKILIQVKETKGQGLDLHPFVIKKALAQINKFSLESLKKLFTQLSNIDYKLKNSQGSPRLLLDLFTVEMCAKQEYN
jgi:DNA polymerase-3 subunit delta